MGLYIFILAACAITIPLYFIYRKLGKNENKLLKIVSVILFICHTTTLFYDYSIDSATIENNLLFEPSLTIFMSILRTFTPIVVASAIFAPYYKVKSLNKIVTFIMPIVSLLNVIFLVQNMDAIYGPGYNWFYNFRTYGFLIELSLLVCLSVIYVFNYIKNKEYKTETVRQFGHMFILFILLIPAFLQLSFFQIVFGTFGDKVGGFNGIHRLTMYFSVAFLMLSYILMRNKTDEQKHLFFSFLTFSAFVQYFYYKQNGLAGLPFHLCNTAIILMFIAHVFKLRGVFYFTYFVNVLGALFAVFMPSLDNDAYSLHNIHFWYNHIYAVVLPLLGVALRVYKRPTLQMMYKAIGIFTLYFISVVIINAWFNNYEQVDYFFIYDNFFVDKLPGVLGPLKHNFVLEIPVGELKFKIFYLFQLTIYAAFVALMFIMWILYDYLYKVSDRHYELLQIKRRKKIDMLNIQGLYIGQELSEPLNKEAIDMIKIDHFTKQYAGSKKPSVEDLCLEIKAGEVYGFLGHNGAGKSTTIKSIVGIQSITSGDIIVDGYSIKKQPLEAKLRMGYVSDNHAVYEKLTGREYINYIADLYLVKQEDRDARIEKYTKMFNLVDAIDREIKGYSHGMKQKLVVIASLIHNPKFWVLDEPLTGLDPTSAFQIKECMREHANNGNIVFFSSHVIEVVEKICDKICIIQRGKLVCQHAIKDLAKEGLTLEQLYMKHVANANYNIDAPDATLEFEKKKSEQA